MARGPLTFKQNDVTRALKATVAAGLAVCRVEIVDGKIIVITGAARDKDDDNDEQREIML